MKQSSCSAECLHPQQDACKTQQDNQNLVLVKGQASRDNPKGRKGCEGCEEGDLQSTSGTTRAFSSREKWVERSTRGNSAIFYLRWMKCFTERKGNNFFSMPVPVMEKIKGLPHLLISSHFLISQDSELSVWSNVCQKMILILYFTTLMKKD